MPLVGADMVRNIFDDVEESEYVCDDIKKAAEEQAQRGKEEAGQQAKTKPYFSSGSSTGEQPNADISSMSGFLSKKQMDMLKPLPKKRSYSEVGKVDERDPTHVDDYYSECYAGYACCSRTVTRSHPLTRTH